VDPEEDTAQEVWSMTGTDAIATRTNQLIADATREVVLVVGDQSLLTEKLVERLNGVSEEVDVLIGAVSEGLQEQIHDAVPRARTFVSGLDWLQAEVDGDEETAIGRLLLVDRSTILVSTIGPDAREEQAVFGGGFRNGLVVIARRLMAQGLVGDRDPAE
jgi:hypothetical protein